MRIVEIGSSVAVNGPAFALAFDTDSIVTKVAAVQAARSLPPGSVVGDMQGGLTFSDAVAAELEARSVGGWREMSATNGDIWTVILLNR